ncbi:MAG TPA: aminotransferase class III-fold pyridoxal phosphate-dependent enzyme [Acidimicrobiales bacterium]|nr:aminotransferase class III-fold pyridoxal phosphate-dependent enzyme [Acidimicrobiales bacterium]
MRTSGPGADQLPAFLHPFAAPAALRGSFIDIVEGSGAEVTDASGRRYIDALASLWYCQVGHGRTEIAEAVAGQMGTLGGFHTFDRYTNPTTDALADRLVGLAPMPDTRVFFTSGGSESVETAIKLARLAQVRAGHPERTVIVSRQPSYHGVTYAAMTASGVPPNQEGFGPLLPDVVRVPYDDLDALDALPAVQEGRVGAVMAEPVVGAGGVWPAPGGYLAGLRERCDTWGAHLIFDEVICAFGRLGSWWGAEYAGVRPDLITFAKGVTSGYLPLGGVLVGPAVRGPLEEDASSVLRHGYTYSGHPSCAAAAMANLDILEREQLLGSADRIAAHLGAGLQELVDGQAVVEVRGTMGVWALGLGADVDATALRDALLTHGIIARPIGASTVAFCPSLVITDGQLEQCVEGARRALADVVAGAGRNRPAPSSVGPARAR